MRRVIILEGPDGVGKSTLADELIGFCNSNNIQNELIHNGPYASRNEALEIYYEQMARASVNDSVTVIDRSWISELIYGKILRNDNTMLREYSKFEKIVLSKSRIMTICCTLPLDIAIMNYENTKSNQLPSDVEKYVEIFNAYIGWHNANSNNTNVISRDYSNKFSPAIDHFLKNSLLDS